jgi:trehalose/maltose transport system permease protein
MPRRAQKLLGRIGLWLLVAVIVAYTAFPFWWAIASSLKGGQALFGTELIPRAPTLDNYTALFAEQRFGRSIVNSVIVAASVVALSLALASGAAYAFGRVQFRGRAPLLMMVLGVSMFPQVAVLSGMFELISWLGLMNSLAGLTLSYLVFTLPFTVWVLTTFMRELPRELEEAAMMDGATAWQTLTRVFLPLMGPALATTGLLAFIAAWNEFLFALTFTLTAETRTVPVAIALISGASAFELPWGRIMAASVVVTVPLILLVVVFQRRIVSGLTAGAVKG